MKKFICTFLVLLNVGVFAQNQMNVILPNGTAITNNQIFGYSTLTLATNKLAFRIQNTTGTAIRVKAKCEAITNANGSDFQICFGLCYPSVAVNQKFPPNQGFVEVAPNSSTAEGDYFTNANPGVGVFPMDYKFKFYMINSNGEEVGNSITLTYRYNPNLSVADDLDLSRNGIEIEKTVTTNSILIKNTVKTQVQIISINGAVLFTKDLLEGENNIDFANQSNGVYFLNFKTESGKTFSKKIIKN